MISIFFFCSLFLFRQYCKEETFSLSGGSAESTSLRTDTCQLQLLFLDCSTFQALLAPTIRYFCFFLFILNYFKFYEPTLEGGQGDCWLVNKKRNQDGIVLSLFGPKRKTAKKPTKDKRALFPSFIWSKKKKSHQRFILPFEGRLLKHLTTFICLVVT